MSYKRNAAVKQTTQTLGLSNLVLLPNDGDTRSFEDALGAGPVTCRYMFRGVGYFQHCRGTFTAPDQLTRDEVILSSSAGAEVSIPSGTTDVYLLDYAQFVLDRFSATKTLDNKDASNSWIYTGSGAADLELPASSTVLPDFWGFVKNVGTGVLTLKGDGSDTIDESGTTSIIIRPKEGGFVFFDLVGGNWHFVRTQKVASVGASLTINGDIAVDQRNDGASQTFTAAAAIAYCADRFYASCTGANITGQRTTLSGSAYRQGYKFTGASSNTAVLFGQRHAAASIPKAAVSNDMTCQVELASSSLSSITWKAYYANATDNFSAKTQIATGSLNITSTPTIYDFTFNGGANAGNGVAIEFEGGALTATNTLWISGVKLEVGSSATPFVPDDYAISLRKCQWYYWQAGGVASQRFGIGSVPLNSVVQGIILPGVGAMRTDPAVSANNIDLYDGTVSIAANAYALVTNSNGKCLVFQFDSATTTLTVGRCAQIAANSTAARIKLDAEI